jgi:branched-subunit amino acid ABC-type transport system permease component
MLAVFFDFIAYKPLRVRNATPLILMIASLGVGIVIRGAIQFIWGPDLRTYRAPTQESINIAGALIYPGDIILVVGVVLIFIIVHFILTKTKFGCSLRAISDNKELAEVSGINTEKTIILLWILSGGLAGLSGAVFAGVLYLGMIPIQGFAIILLIFAAVIVGTIGHVYGAIAGGYIIGLVDEISAYHFGRTIEISEYSKVVVFIVLILVILLMPKGIFGRKG